MNEESLGPLKTLTRNRLRLIWEMAQAGGVLSAADALTAQLMGEHPEWHQRWARADELSDAEFTTGDVNPALHIVAHQIVWNQIDGALPAAREVYEALQAQGLTAHEAIHRIGAVLMEEVYAVLKHQRPYDKATYVRKLQALVKRAQPMRRRRRR